MKQEPFQISQQQGNSSKFKHGADRQTSLHLLDTQLRSGKARKEECDVQLDPEDH